MKKVIFCCSFSGILLSFGIVQGQYIYRPSTSNAKTSNTPVYQYKPAASQGKTAATVSNSPVRAVITKNVLFPSTAWEEFRSTPLYQQRQATFANAFQNPSHVYTMDDGTKLTINFIKNPSFGGMGTKIITNSTSGVPVHGSTSSGQGSTSSGQSGWRCTTNYVTISANSTNFNVADYILQARHIYPGAVYSFENYANGSFVTPAAARNPLKIFTTDRNIQGDDYVLVDNPDEQSIYNAISQLSSRFPTNYSINAATDYSVYESDNSADMAIKITAGGSAYGFSFKGSFGSTKNSHQRYLTIDAKKILFTLNAIPPQNGYYKDPSVESTPNLMVIGTVSYGIRILANLTINISSDSMGASFDATYNSGIYNANMALNFVQKNASNITSVNAYEIGGPNVGPIQLDPNNLINSINSILAGATYQNAQPIDYQLYDMAGDVIGSSSSTDQFIEQNCTPDPNANTPVLTQATVRVDCGGDCKDHDTHYEYDLYNSAGQLVGSFRNNNNNTAWADNSMNQSGDHLAIMGSPKLSDFYNGTPTFRMTIYPNGHDNVEMAKITLTLIFTSPDGSTINYPVSWGNVTLSQDGPSINLLFNYNTGTGFQAQNY
ncbi:thiol-activated cytolysin family protein [Thermoflavifilum thermophilum]|nr:thiol-activated cytolysin family protein [Thermoflavifilum thermophilum]